MDLQYPAWFLLPAVALFAVLFVVPTLAGFAFSFTRWSLFEVDFTGFDNYIQFLREPALLQGLFNTLVFAFVTCFLKVVLGLSLALLLAARIPARVFLRSVVFFPVIISTIGVGITFKVLMDPSQGIINGVLDIVGLQGPGWLVDPSLALLSVALVDVWRGVGLAALIFLAGLIAVPRELLEAAEIDGAGRWSRFRHVMMPLLGPATATVVVLSLIGGLRSFDLIWAMTRGGPGFSSDVISSVIFKQYQAGFFGLSAAGNVVLFALILLIIVPSYWLLSRGRFGR